MTLAIITQFPQPASTDVARDTYIFVGASNTLTGIDSQTARITVDGIVAYYGRDGFSRPNFRGEVFQTNTYLAIKVQPRRKFAPGAQVTVRVELTNDVRPATQTVDTTYTFGIVSKKVTVVNASQLSAAQRRMATPFTGWPYLDSFRQALGSTLTPNTRLVTSVAAFRLSQAPLQALAVPLVLPEPPLFTDQDLRPLSALTSILPALNGMWEPALAELRQLGVGPQTLDTLRRSMGSEYPQNQVGAVCGAVLLGAAFLDAQGQ